MMLIFSSATMNAEMKPTKLPYLRFQISQEKTPPLTASCSLMEFDLARTAGSLKSQRDVCWYRRLTRMKLNSLKIMT